MEGSVETWKAEALYGVRCLGLGLRFGGRERVWVSWVFVGVWVVVEVRCSCVEEVVGGGLL